MWTERKRQEKTLDDRWYKKENRFETAKRNTQNGEKWREAMRKPATGQNYQRWWYLTDILFLASARVTCKHDILKISIYHYTSYGTFYRWKHFLLQSHILINLNWLTNEDEFVGCIRFILMLIIEESKIVHSIYKTIYFTTTFAIATRDIFNYLFVFPSFSVQSTHW